MKMDYLKNIELAKSLGFEEINDSDAYKGRYFIKEGVKWIHDISSLKRRLGTESERELISLGYDVASYYKYIDYSNSMVDQEIARIKAQVNDDNSPLCGNLDVLFDTSLVKSMQSLSDEGFSDEILADFAHQMGKD